MYYMLCLLFFFFKQKTAYEMRISDWSSDVCSSDLPRQWTLGVEFYRNFLEIDCVAPHAFIAAFVPGMLEAGWGRIVNISTSVDTMLRFWPYGSAKAALDAQTAVLAVQLEGTGVTANILGPGTFVKPAPIGLDDGTVIRPDHRSEEHA